MIAGVDPADEIEARQLIWDAYGYKTHEPAVDAFHASRARTKIVSSPAQTSKSYAAFKEVLPDILLHGARVEFDPDVKTQVGWIVAPNYVLAKEFDYAWADLVENASKVGLDFTIEEGTNNPTQGNMRIVINWGRNPSGEIVKDIIVVKSATNINVLQSEAVDWAILSEAARLPQLVWTKFLSTRCKRSIWPSTPDIMAVWIWDEIQKASNPELGIDSFSFTGRANPTYDWERYWIEHMKTEESELGQVSVRPNLMTSPPSSTNGHDCFDEIVTCEAMKEDGFAEQFGGRWVFHRNRVVPLRERVGSKGQPSHLFDEDYDWFAYADMHISFDYGFSDGACVGFWFLRPGQIALYDSVYETGLVPDDLVNVIEEKRLSIAKRFNRDPKTLIKRYVGDPQQPAVEEVFRRRGLPIWPVNKVMQRSRKAGHLEFMNALKIDPATGEPGLIVHRRNKSVIKEWRTLRWNEKVGEDAPSALKGADHAYDMARYFIVTRPVTWSQKAPKSRHSFEAARQSILKAQGKQKQRTVDRKYGRRRFGGLPV